MHAATLRHLLDHREAVEARHERIVQRGRDRERRQGACELQAVADVAHQARLDQRLRQLLDEQRHAIGPSPDLLDGLRRQRPAAGDQLDQRLDLPADKAIERQRRDVRVPHPQRQSVGPSGHDQQHRQPGDALDERVEQLPGGGIEPLRVLEDHQHRLPPGQGFEVPEQRIEDAPLLLLRRQAQERMAFVFRDAEQLGQQRHLRFGFRRQRREQRREPASADLGRRIPLEPGGVLQVPDHRP